MKTIPLLTLCCLALFLALASATAHGSRTDIPTTPGLNAVFSDTSSYVRPPSNRVTGLDAVPAEDTVETSPGTTVQFDPARMMRPEELRPGMKGYGLSVFKGLRPEKFEVEVVGVRHRTFAGDDMILCMCKSPYLEDIGVIAGMSGSPVFINDRLIGAVAYGWMFSTEPLAGITPIESMLRVYNATSERLRGVRDRTLGSSFDSYAAYRRMHAERRLVPLFDGGGMAPIQVGSSELGAETSRRYHLPDSFTMHPLSTPLFVSSASPRTLDIMRQVFSNLDVEPIPLSASGGNASLDSENSPGGPVKDLQAFAAEISGGYGLAVPFVEGDVSMAGVGTVTFRQAEKLVAFGHPMWGQGVSDYPMAAARINALVRSSMRPFKLGESIGQVGTVLQDRLPAIGGIVGPTARMFPVHVTIEDANYRRHREFNYRVWDDRDMGPMFAMMVIFESIDAAARTGNDSAVLYDYTLQFDDGTSITKQDYLVDSGGGYTAALDLASDMGMLTSNPFKRVRTTGVEFTYRVADRFPEARILSASLDKTSYRPGDTVTVSWDVQPYRRPKARMKHEIRLPANIPEGDYELAVCDGASRASIESSRNPGGNDIHNYANLVDYLRRNYPRNKVYVTLQDRDTGVSVRGQELSKLPASVIDTIQDTIESRYVSPVRGNILADAELVTGHEIGGSQSLAVRVRVLDK